jgi:hypothetical protein
MMGKKLILGFAILTTDSHDGLSIVNARVSSVISGVTNAP